MPRSHHHPLPTPRRHDRCRHHRQICRRILPHRQLSAAPSSAVGPNPADVIDIPISEATSRCRVFPTTASQTLYRTREAKVGSPSNSAIRSPSKSVILLISLEIGVVVPDQFAHPLLSGTL